MGKKFEFLVDKEKNTLTTKREFAANRQFVWDAYTKSELLDQWFAPKPMTTKTKIMDFREGGKWHYAMVEPEGKEYWGLTEYVKIKPIDYYTSIDGFCDENGKLNPELPCANWEVIFTDVGENTLVKTIVRYDSLESLESIIQMGMEEGLVSTLEKLDELIISRN